MTDPDFSKFLHIFRNKAPEPKEEEPEVEPVDEQSDADFPSLEEGFQRDGWRNSRRWDSRPSFRGGGNNSLKRSFNDNSPRFSDSNRGARNGGRRRWGDDESPGTRPSRFQRDRGGNENPWRRGPENAASFKYVESTEEIKPEVEIPNSENELMTPVEPNWANPRFPVFSRASFKSAEKELCKKEDKDLRSIDTHCHLDFLMSKTDRDSYMSLGVAYKEFKLNRLDEFGGLFEGCIACFTNPIMFVDTVIWESVVRLDDVYVTFGCHPHWVASFDGPCRDAMIAALKHPKVVASGEFGLDYCVRRGGDGPDRELQKRVFRDQLKIGVAAGKPLVIHCRQAEEDCLAIMKELVPHDYPIHRHCVTISMMEIQEWVDLFPNCYFGFTNYITAAKNDAVHDVVRRLPMNRILLETDSPYHVPEHISSKLSHPGMVSYVAAQIARLRGLTLEEVIRECRKNTRALYSI